MRLASALIGGLGALPGALKGLFLVLISLTLGGLERCEFNPFLFLAIGANGVFALSCILGAVGAGLALSSRLRGAFLLMLIGAAGVAVAAAAYRLLWPLTQPPDVQAAVGSLFTDLGFYLTWLFPVPPRRRGAGVLRPPPGRGIGFRRYRSRGYAGCRC